VATMVAAVVAAGAGVFTGVMVAAGVVVATGAVVATGVLEPAAQGEGAPAPPYPAWQLKV